MHPEAREFVQRIAGKLDGRVVEFGSRQVNLDPNGELDQELSLRPLFKGEYLGIDLHPGPGVDVIANCATWHTKEPFDTVVCCEVLEHTDQGPDILESAFQALRPGGTAIFTMATHPRVPHSGVDGEEVREGEYYANVDPDIFLQWSERFDVLVLEVDSDKGDLRVLLQRPMGKAQAGGEKHG